MIPQAPGFPSSAGPVVDHTAGTVTASNGAVLLLLLALAAVLATAAVLYLRLLAVRRRQRELESTIRRRDAERERLAAVVERVNHGQDLPEVLEFLWESSRDLLPCDRIGYAVIEDGMVRARWARIRHGEIRLGVGTEARLEETSLAALAHDGGIRIIGDLEAHLGERPGSEPTRLLVEEGMRSSLSVPLRAFGEPVGFLFFNSVEPQAYLPDHVRWFGAMAAQLSVIIEKSRLLSEATERAATDPLTGLANRRAFEEHLGLEWRRASRGGEPVTLMLVDIDHFKAFNDRYGHAEGDACLVRVAELVAGFGQRAGDLASRWGGEEFTLVLPGVAAEPARELAERLRRKIETWDALPEALPVDSRITVSIGVASMVPAAGLRPSSLFAAADRALYRARETGRNKVVNAERD